MHQGERRAESAKRGDDEIGGAGMRALALGPERCGATHPWGAGGGSEKPLPKWGMRGSGGCQLEGRVSTGETGVAAAAGALYAAPWHRTLPAGVRQCSR